MDLHTILASGSNVETLKCFVCKNYLSYFPVSLCSNGQSVCGRCVVPPGINAVRDLAFETVVENLKFPCRYESEGCFEDLQPKDVPQHEENCPLRIVKCVVDGSRSCEWSGSLPTLMEHCQKEHAEIFLKSGEFEMDLAQSLESQYLMEVDDKLFIFHQKKFDLDHKILTCAVYPNEYEDGVESYSGQLSIRKGKTTIVHEFDTSSCGEKIFEEICLQFARKETGFENSVTVKLSLGKKGTENEFENERKISELRDHLKCSKCGDFAGPLIFRNSATMAVLCGDSCSKKSMKVEDKVLTTVVTLLRYPCRFQEYGCTYTSFFEDAKTHQDFCQYRKEKCIFVECQWEGLRKETENHLHEKHARMINNKSEHEIIISIGQLGGGLRIAQCRNRLFRFDYSVEKDSLMCSVLKIGICKQKFNFEVETVDASEANNLRRHVITQRCEQLTEHSEYFSADACKLPKEQVFGKSENTTLKVRIFKAS